MTYSYFVNHKPCFAIPSHVGVVRSWVRLKAPPEVACNDESYLRRQTVTQENPQIDAKPLLWSHGLHDIVQSVADWQH
jgi:hypothetical protein